MFPSIQIGSFALSTHLLLNLLAGVVVGVAAWLLARKEYPHVSWSEAIDITFYLFCGVMGGALVAATAPYVINGWFGHPIPPLLWEGWQNWFGAVTGGSLAGWLYCRRNRRPLGWSFDLFAPLLPLGLAIVRTGCLLAGDSYGKLTTDWPAMVLPDVNGVWASRYPTQIVDILMGLVIAAILFAYDPFVRRVLGKAAPWPFAGFKFWLYVILFCGQRLYFESWRADTPPLAGAVTWNHLYAALGLCLALGVIGWKRSARSGGGS